MEKMTRTIQARFDGKAFYPEEPLAIAPNTTVRLTVETPDALEAESSPRGGGLKAVPVKGEPYSFLKFAMSLDLQGPADWAENVDEYLYGGKKLPDD
jgi:hypothetical protein